MDKKNYDKVISKIIEDWISLSESKMELFYKRALTRFVIPEIYERLRTEILNQAVLKIENRYNFLVGFKKSVFSFLWLIKWYWFRISVKNKKIIVCSLNLSQPNSVCYLESILDFGEKNNIIIVHFNSSLHFNHLFKNNFFCFPYSFFQFVINKSEQENIQPQIKYGLEQLIFNEMGILINFDGIMNEKYLLLRKMHLSFEAMLKKISSENKIEFYFTDGDFSSNKVLFNFSCSVYNIKTVSADHSFIFNNHYHLNSFSDFSLVWGQYQANRIEKYYKNKSTKIIEVGKPDLSTNRNDFSTNGKSVVYYFPSFHNPLFQSVYRSLEYSFNIAGKIQNSLKINFPEYSFFVKPHPADNLNEKLIGEGFRIWINEKNSNGKICLAIVEDSSVSIELLNCDTNIFYIKDSNGTDNVGFGTHSSVYLMSNTNEFPDLFKKMISSNLNSNERQKLITYFYSQDFKEKFDKSLQFILENQPYSKSN